MISEISAKYEAQFICVMLSISLSHCPTQMDIAGGVTNFKRRIFDFTVNPLDSGLNKI